MRGSTDDQISHLLRRFGLGAGRRELEKYRSLGVEGTAHRLIEYDQVPEVFPVSVWEWHTNEKGAINMSANSTRAWWIMRMANTERPLEEKLTMFWHDHFAVSASKVPAPEMDDYLFRLKKYAVAPFEEALKSITYSAAMVRWLDSLGSYPARPNENFGREVMELFTLGIGNYSEQDIRETAKCFLGLGLTYAIPTGMKADDYYRLAATQGLPIVSVTVAPDFEDTTIKTIRGQTGPFTSKDILKNLSDDPATAHRVIGKLWRYFVSEKPPTDSVRDHLTKVWKKNDLKVRPVLLEMTRLHAFWDAETVRRLPKSPMDFTVSLARQVGMGPKYLRKRMLHAGPTDSIRPVAGGPFYGLASTMANQGLSLLYPEDVSGWRWGSAWLTSASILARLKFMKQLFNSGWADDYLSETLVPLKGKNPEYVVAQIENDLDVVLSKDQTALLLKQLDRSGGPAKAFNDVNSSRRSMAQIGGLLNSVPAFHLG